MVFVPHLTRLPVWYFKLEKNVIFGVGDLKKVEYDGSFVPMLAYEAAAHDDYLLFIKVRFC